MGFDGLKIDGQHLNAAPPCFTSSTDMPRPKMRRRACRIPEALWNTAQASKPGALVEICPCGRATLLTPPHEHDGGVGPESSWQVRLKGKTLKALAGDRIAYFGDFVELSRGGEDFTPTAGVDGAIGTNFAWPGAPGKKDKTLLLRAKREALWRIGRSCTPRSACRRRISRHAMRPRLRSPRGRMSCPGRNALLRFLREGYEGSVELRGLDAGGYEIVDYVPDASWGRVAGSGATLHATITPLLIAARPLSGT
jgi:alpha-galactosidase